MVSLQKIKLNINKSSRTIMIIGILILILGIVGIVYPATAGEIAAVTIGIILVGSGVFRFIFAFFSPSMGSALMRFLMAILMIIAGVWTVGDPDMGLEALTLVLAIFFIIDGITEIGFPFNLVPIGGGFYFLISGIISIILGILIFSKWPESSNYALGLYVGIKLAFDGLAFILTGGALGKATRSV